MRNPETLRKKLLLLALPLGALSSCSSTTVVPPHFDGPVAATVLQPETGGPFSAAIGFVSNSRGGRITPLDLKAGRILSDDPSSSFLRGSYIPTGAQRILGDIVVRAPSVDRIDVFVADFAWSRLLEVPYVVGLDTAPIEIVPTATEPLFEDLDGSGDSAELENLELRAGYTTTELWTLTYHEGAWDVEGSRSGKQYYQARAGDNYHSSWREIQFDVVGTASEGDRITFSTDTGVIEHEVGGDIQAMLLSPDQGLLALSTFDRVSAETALKLFDPAGRALLGAIPLPKGSQPYRMDWDDLGERLFVADVSLPAVYEIQIDPGAPEKSLVTTIPMPAPVSDLAWIALDDPETERLAVAPVGLNRVDLIDLIDGETIDPNPYTVEITGLDLGSPVTGLAAAPILVPTKETTSWGAHYERPLIAVSLFNGSLVELDARTGCLAPDAYGPRSYEVSTDDFDFTDLGATSDPYIWEDEATGRHITVNACPGLAVDETLDIVYNEAEQVWTVDGSRSGRFQEVARENERYISDQALLSFTIMSGLLPTTDGDSFLATIQSGVLRVTGDMDGDGTVDEPFKLPGEPETFWYYAGATGGGWDVPVKRVYALWPITNSDLVVRARMDKGNPEIVWE